MVGKGGITRKGLRLLQYIIKIDLLRDTLNILMFMYSGFSKKCSYDSRCKRESRYLKNKEQKTKPKAIMWAKRILEKLSICAVEGIM